MNKKLIKKIVELYKNGDLSKEVTTQLIRESEEEDIAIIGIGSKTSISDDYNDLWDTLKNRKSHIRPCPKERIQLTSEYLGENGDREELYHHGAFLSDYAIFDYQLFGLSKEEADIMDPMQRIMLQVAYRTLEDAGYLGKRPNQDTTGVFIGANFSNKQFVNYLSLLEEANFQTIIANWTSGVATRLSNCFDLRGVSTVIENSCIASIITISEACTMLKMGTIDTALVGTVNTILIPDKRISLNKVFAHDSDVVSRPYSDVPGGNYVGEGGAALLLKPLSKAIEHGDKIHGVIKSSCVNNNGATSDFVQSNAEMIENVVINALKLARIEPDQIEYVEGEGYCEKLEQALEVTGLTKGFSNFTNKKQFCSLGAASVNIGYSEASVGIFNLICCLLAIKHKQLPPIYRYDKLSNAFDLYNTPFYINDCLKTWDSKEDRKRTAAIFTQGFGGGNGFTIIQEYLDQLKNTEKNKETTFLFVLSALSEYSFQKLIERYLNFFEDNKDISLGDLCYTAAVKREHYVSYRMVVETSDIADLHDQISKWNINRENTSTLKAGKIENSKCLKNKKQALKVEKSIADSRLQEIGQYYMDGYTFDFTKLFHQGCFRNIDLPLYPFDGVKCWV